MRGGYAAAKYWNDHYIEMEQRAADRAIEKLEKERDAIGLLYARTPDDGLWSAWYDYMTVNLRQEQSDLYHYGCGGGSGASRVYARFKAIVEFAQGG